VLAEDAALSGEEYAALKRSLTLQGTNEVDFRSI
jgi:hypothetical protein